MTDTSTTAEAFDAWCVVEAWRPVVGYEGLYEVSDQGRVRRVGKATGTGASRGGSARVGRILRLQEDRSSYLAVNLWRDGKARRFLVHRLVAAAFLGPAPDGHVANHRDGVKTNIAAGNLEWATHSENNQHAYRTGLRTAHVLKGEAHPNAKLTAEDVREIRRRYRPGVYGTPRLAREFGTNATTIYRIVTGNAWKEN